MMDGCLKNFVEIKAAPQTGIRPKTRDVRLDALRGLFLLVMAGVHVPTPVSRLMQDPVGYNGSAEGFIFLSACLAGIVYGRTYWQADWKGMARRMWKRSRQIYFVHVGLLIPIALIAWLLAARLPPLANHFSDFLIHPWGSLALIPLLLHQPPLFDILPLYIIFLAASPWVMGLARRRGWGLVVALSALLWLAAQLRLDARLEGDPARLLPFRWGAFDLWAWQFLWVSGLALGEISLRRRLVKSKYRWVAIPAAALVVLAFLTRWGFWPQTWWNADMYLWMDKWTLGPLRLLNAAAWAVLFMAWNPQPPKLLMAPTSLLGRNSLSVFAFHLPLVITATAVVQELALSDRVQTWVGILVMALLFPWAAVWEFQKRRRARREAAKAAWPAVKPPSPTSRADAKTAPVSRG